LIRARVGGHAIPCDLRDGYVYIRRDGSQTVLTGTKDFAINPYPFLLGLTFAAQDAGVEVHENTQVTRIAEDAGGCVVTVGTGEEIEATHVIATGGHRMAVRITLLRPLRSRTAELRVSTLITEPVPESVLHHIMPVAGGRRFPFANDALDIAYGNVDQHGRITFGASATALHDPDFSAIARIMHAIFPDLASRFKASVGHPLRWRPLVVAERLCFTRDQLPNVGIIGYHQRVFYVHALGGHGLAIGTMLGEAVARKTWGAFCHGIATDPVFDDFAAIPHGWVPQWQPARVMTTALGRKIRLLQHRKHREVSE
jgi:glycine/D-amino acid oxidase-like deaminating enzyme